ncbi:alkaline phosphatase family protein [Saliphagus infecundisoli]|uniref:Alkaline phosphatase family protein n=1 Tax=Saliphagus infecundisoli TaxID=1849069 RepID=A0ABD5QGC2_9EURY|nr:alkaline phosphatase family protein [Saliphagus infecundisoli]
MAVSRGGVGPVQALPYLTADGTPVREAVPDAPDPSALSGATPIYPRVPDRISTGLFEPHEISDGRRHFSRGADRYTGYSTVPELAGRLRRPLERSPESRYLYAHVPTVDRVSHRSGPWAPETDAALKELSDALWRELVARLDGRVAKRTLLVLTADHGQIDSSGNNVDLREYVPLWESLATDSEGNRIPPVGGSRQLQLHLRARAAEGLQRRLRRGFDCRVFARPEYESRELFGPTDPSAVYDRNAPDLLWFPSGGGAWYDDDSLRTVGLHGGLSRAEMLVPFAAFPLGAARDRNAR